MMVLQLGIGVAIGHKERAAYGPDKRALCNGRARTRPSFWAKELLYEAKKESFT
jgi:hypothetical protein